MKNINEIKYDIERAFFYKKRINCWLDLLIKNKENPDFYLKELKEKIDNLEETLLKLTFDLLIK